jgi:S-methylmethionine-dependent homocysteine/selenocysteine methylase
MNTYQTKEKLMAEQTDAHDFVQSRNKAMQFDREKRQKKIKDNLELHQDTQNTIKSMADKLTSLNKSADEVEENLKKTIKDFFSQPIKYLEDKKVYSDLTKIRQLTDELDKLLDIE